MNRHLSRVIIMQTLYEWDFRPKGDLDETDKLIVKAAPEWPIEQISTIDKTILRIAIFEILHSDDIPPKVAINEAVELGKTFGGENSSKFINGVLGTVYRQCEKYDPKLDEGKPNE